MLYDTKKNITELSFECESDESIPLELHYSWISLYRMHYCVYVCVKNVKHSSKWPFDLYILCWRAPKQLIHKAIMENSVALYGNRFQISVRVWYWLVIQIHPVFDVHSLSSMGFHCCWFFSLVLFLFHTWNQWTLNIVMSISDRIMSLCYSIDRFHMGSKSR